MYALIRRFIDIVFALVGIIVMLPIAIPLFIALRLTGEGYVFYRQTRVGYRNQTFEILKLATMLNDSPNLPGGSLTLRNDPRITPLGGFLRRSKLNEVPQLWNILKGDMSIVGARPLMPVSFEMYRPSVQQIVYQSRPGLTGIASLAFRDEEAYVSATDMDPVVFYRNIVCAHKGRLELWYQRNRSLLTDLKIVILTAWAVFVPGSTMLYRWFPSLPKPPAELDPEQLCGTDRSDDMLFASTQTFSLNGRKNKGDF